MIDAEPYDYHRIDERRARKDHKCYECGGLIEPEGKQA